MQDTIFSATLGGDLQGLCVDMIKNTKRDFISHIKQCETVLKVDMQKAILFIDGIDETKKLSPVIYVLLERLKHAKYVIKSRDAILDVISLLVALDDSVYQSNSTISSIKTEWWESDYIEKLRSSNVKTESGKTTLMEPILDDSMEKHSKSINDALNTLNEQFPELYKEYQHFVKSIKLFRGQGIVGSTSFENLGCIYLREPSNEIMSDQNYFLEHLVHEISHLKLYHIMQYDKLFERTDALYPAPIRFDQRPMYGIFHATFVLSRMVYVFSNLPSSEEVVMLRNAFTKKFDAGYKVVSENANLTANGQHLVKSIGELVNV